MGPLAGLHVVELVLAPGELGRGMATGWAGMFLADQGAEVVRVVTGEDGLLEPGVGYGQVWHRSTRTAGADLGTDHDVESVRRLLGAADVALVGGTAPLVEGGGPLSYQSLSAANPGLVYCQVAPAAPLGGDGQDYELLAQARCGVMLLLQGDRERPVVAALELGAFGAGLAAVGGVLAALVHRAATGAGMPVSTSLEDGESALLAMLLNRASEPTKGFMMTLGLGTKVPTWLYRCADGSYLHLHPGAKGAYQRIISLFGDEESAGTRWGQAPSRDGRQQHERWAAAVASKDRDVWLRDMRTADIPVQPVLEPGEALFDDHVRAVGLAVEQPGADGEPILAVGTPVRVRGEEPVPPRGTERATLDELVAAWPAAPAGHAAGPPQPPTTLPLEGVRILDFGHFLAGPLGDALLGDLGAEIIKVEPIEGDPLRLAHDHDLGSVFACAQRGKRSLSLDLKAPEAASILARLFAWADIVHHNFRPGAAERLGIDEATARAANPDLVYCYSPAFGSTGPAAGLPGFDQMFQAFCGLEAAAGGEGNPPMWYGPAPVDTGGGWLSAIAMLLGRLRHLQSGGGIYVESTQLGAGLSAISGVFARGDEIVAGPRLDTDQTGFGPGYRIYQCADGAWLAVVVPTIRAWEQLRALETMPDLPERFVALRAQDDAAARELEATLSDAFARHDAAHWLQALADTDVRVEPVHQGPLTAFLDLFYDRPGNDELGRIARFEQPEYGVVEQVAFAARLDGLRPRVRRRVPRIGEHSSEVLGELGFDPSELDRLLADGVIRQGP